MKKLGADLKMMGKGIKEVFSISKGLPISLLLLSVFGALQPYLFLYFTARIINALLLAEKRALVIYTLAYLGCSIGCSMLESLFREIGEFQREKFNAIYQMKISEKAAKLPYEMIEDEKIQQKKQRIYDMQMATGSGIFSLIYQVQAALHSIFSMVMAAALSMSVFLKFQTGGTGIAGVIASPAGSVLLLLIMAFTVPVSMAAAGRETSRTNRMIGGLGEFLRLFDFYYSQYLTDYHVGKDIRLHGQKELIEGQYAEQLEGAVGTFRRIRRMQMKYRKIISLISILLTVYVYLFVGVKALLGLVGVGDILAYVGCISGFLSGINSFMTTFAMLRTNNEAMEAYFSYMELPEEADSGKKAVCMEANGEGCFVFENVSFRYPGSGEYALKNINLRIGGISKTAIVGTNGSGKTTLIKLLCRLYRPEEGRILLNGVDIWEYSFDEYTKLISAVFQDFKLFAFSLGENLAASCQYDSDKAKLCIEKAGAWDCFEKMGKEMDIFLYRDFDSRGRDISGGEAQKIAIARALYRDSPVMILDEPTAALDPRAEAEVYESIHKNMADRLVIFISHRLSSCKFCDRIIVLDDGRIIQEGSHAHLLAEEDGKYAQMWHAQAQYYVSEDPNQ